MKQLGKPDINMLTKSTHLFAALLFVSLVSVACTIVFLVLKAME